MTKELCGKFVGIPNTRVCLEATTKGGKLKQVEDFRFKRLPARCDDGSKRLVSGKRAKIDGDGSKFRSRRLKIKGDFSAIDAKVAGEVKGESKKAGGEVRVRFRSSSGAACDSRDRKWKVG